MKFPRSMSEEGFPDFSGFIRFYPDFNFLSEEKDKFFIFIFCKKFIFFSKPVQNES